MNRRECLFAGAPWALGLTSMPAWGALEEGVTDQEILIGMSAPLTGASSSVGIDLYRGAMACFMATNSAGGIYGRKLSLRIYDDGYEPSRTVANTMTLLDKDRVFALFNYAGTDCVARILPLLKKFQQSHPVLFFSWTGADLQRREPYDSVTFNLRASYRQEAAALVSNLAGIGRTRIAVIFQADAYGRSGWESVRQSLAERGMKIVAEATYARGAPYSTSFTDQAELMKEARPDAIIMFSVTPSGAGLVRDMRRAGVTVPIATPSPADLGGMLKLLREVSQADRRDYTRDLISSNVFPIDTEQAGGVWRRYLNMLDKHPPMLPPMLINPDYVPRERSMLGLEGFLNASVLVEALSRLGKNPRRDQLATVMSGLTSLELGSDFRASFGPGDNQGSDTIYFSNSVEGSAQPLLNWQVFAQ